MVRELKKEMHRVGEHLVAQGQVKSDVVDEFGKTGRPAHFLLLNFVGLEKTLKERGDRLLPEAQSTE